MRRFDHFLRLASYLFLGRSYQAYRLAKKVYWALFKRGIPHRLPSYNKIAVIVEGFAHSGNSFIRTNILPGYQSKTSSYHRSWAVKMALNHNVPTVVLFRHPLEAAKSCHYRSASSPRGPISLGIVLGCWISYHRSIWGLRHSILLVPFTDIVDNYALTRNAIEHFAPIKMNHIPDYSNMNRHLGPRPPVEMGFVTRALLWYAERIYRTYLKQAKNQHTFVHLPRMDGGALMQKDPCASDVNP